MARVLAAARVAARSRTAGAELVISHDPRVTFATQLCLRASGYRGKHMAFSFNYPELPSGAKASLHRSGFRDIDRFVVYSTAEKQMYHDFFRIPEDRIEFIHWGVRPPSCGDGLPVVPGDYVCSIGGNARDYATLLKAASQLPEVPFVWVVRPHNIAGMTLPSNVRVMVNVPFPAALNVLAHSRFMALPLANTQVPCGHVTLVNCMFFGKAMVITRSSGVADYVKDGDNATLCNAGDAEELAARIGEMWNDPAMSRRLGDAGLKFAHAHCREENVLGHFKRIMAELGIRTE